MKNYQTFEEWEKQDAMDTLIGFRNAFIAVTIFWAIVILAICYSPRPAHAQVVSPAVTIDMAKIAKIESSGCLEKVGHYEDARGCYQITKPVIDEWNVFHPKEKYTHAQMHNDETCFKVADWYMNKRIPQMLAHFRIADTTRNRLICYNAGIKTLVQKRALSDITKRYLAKYFKG